MIKVRYLLRLYASVCMDVTTPDFPDKEKLAGKRDYLFKKLRRKGVNAAHIKSLKELCVYSSSYPVDWDEILDACDWRAFLFYTGKETEE